MDAASSGLTFLPTRRWQHSPSQSPIPITQAIRPLFPSTPTTSLVTSPTTTHLSGDGDLDLDTSLDVDDDLLDDLGWGVQVDQALVDSEEISLVSLPFSFRTAYPSPISLLLYIL